MRVWYVGLESYRERYTERLTHWVRDAWERRGELTVIDGDSGTDSQLIETGQVLDVYRRTRWATSQIGAMATLLERGPWPDVIHFDDLFHPGFEALPYNLAQQPDRPPPRIYVRNHAQSMDEYDFTHPMRAWMRSYEQLTATVAAGIFVASSVHRDAWRVANLPGRVHVVGLPFSQDDVRGFVGEAWQVPYTQRPLSVCYSSRFDAEKQPHFFLDVASYFHETWPQVRFLICTGARELRSTDPTAVTRAWALHERGAVEIHQGLDRASYYRLLAESRVHFNCALQDYVSNTLLEASALGTPTVAPAWRSFPEVYGNRQEQHLYAAFQLPAACKLLARWLHGGPEPPAVVGEPAAYHSQTLDRIWSRFEQDAEEG